SLTSRHRVEGVSETVWLAVAKGQRGRSTPRVEGDSVKRLSHLDDPRSEKRAGNGAQERHAGAQEASSKAFIDHVKTSRQARMPCSQRWATRARNARRCAAEPTAWPKRRSNASSAAGQRSGRIPRCVSSAASGPGRSLIASASARKHCLAAHVASSR